MGRILLHSRAGNVAIMVTGGVECLAALALFVKAVIALWDISGLQQFLLPVLLVGTAAGGAILFEIGRRGLGLPLTSPRTALQSVRRVAAHGAPGR